MNDASGMTDAFSYDPRNNLVKLVKLLNSFDMSVKKANIGELKTHLSLYVKSVKNGGKVLITERNVPVAKIVQLDADDLYESEEEQLIAEGILSPPASDKPLPESFWRAKRPNIPLSKILEVIREERDED